MASPAVALTTHRPDLGGSLQEFDLMMNANGFIGARILRPINVAKKIGKFGRIPLEQLLQYRETLRAPASNYSRSRWTFIDDDYRCREHGLEEVIDEDEAEMYEDYFDAESVSRDRALHGILLAAERRAAAAIFDTTRWTGAPLTTSLSIPWSTHATATPIDDVDNARRQIWLNSGMNPNVLIINQEVLRHLRSCAQIIDRVKQQNFQDARPGALTAAALAELFLLREVIVADAAQNTANEGAAAQISPIWSDSLAMLCRVASTDDPREACIARTFRWKGGQADLGAIVESYDETQTRGRVIRVRHDVDEKVIYTEMGHLLTNVTA